MLPSVDKVEISRSSFLNVQNTLQVLGSTQGTGQEDIIINDSHVKEIDKNIS